MNKVTRVTVQVSFNLELKSSLAQHSPGNLHFYMN